jgi:hypothetical protein
VYTRRCMCTSCPCRQRFVFLTRRWQQTNAQNLPLTHLAQVCNSSSHTAAGRSGSPDVREGGAPLPSHALVTRHRW